VVHFLGHYVDAGAFWGILSFVGAAVVAFIFFLIQDRRAKSAMVRQMLATAKMLSQAMGKEIPLDGIPEAEDPKLKVYTAKGLAAMRKCKWDKAIRLFQKALGHAAGTKPSVALFNLVGLCYDTPGRLSQALDSYEESARLAQQCGDKQGRGAALGNIGTVYSVKGEPDKALKYLEDALAIHREIGYQEGVASDLGNIGLIYRAKGEPDKALKYHEDALAIHREVGYREGVASALGNIGLIYSDKGEPDKALVCLAEALLLFSAVGARPSVAQAANNLKPLLGQIGREKFVAGCVKAGMSCDVAEKLANTLARPD